MLRTTKKLTLVFPFRKEEGRILLGMKKRGFGAGKYNGFGGKVEGSETIEEGAVRELVEECSLVASLLCKHGIINFKQVHLPDETAEVHVYVCSEWTGDPIETEEMQPQWFEIKDIPFDMMWPDDRIWLPRFLEGAYFRATFSFDEQNKTILDYCLEELPAAPEAPPL